ncbi:MAG: 30S ribosomal protein S6 [Patescibacteria group bacterium]|nr:30S ribosomal protein S6 [bacterium]MDZ4241028.1 30S ribosomal protein S6 [Patescibacteria group bacterium]
MKKEQPENAESMRIYEVGYSLIPTLPEEKLSETVLGIKSAIEEKRGVLISEDFPKMKALAYTLSKTSAGRREHFTHAYFGWMKFELSRDEVTSLKEKLQNDPLIVRLILIETVRENTLATLRTPLIRKTEEPKKDMPKQEVSQEELDKSIEKLVGDAKTEA